jgi:hypothetical protein
MAQAFIAACLKALQSRLPTQTQQQLDSSTPQQHPHRHPREATPSMRLTLGDTGDGEQGSDMLQAGDFARMLGQMLTNQRILAWPGRRANPQPRTPGRVASPDGDRQGGRRGDSAGKHPSKTKVVKKEKAVKKEGT